MKTVMMLMVYYDGRPVVPLHDVWRDFFKPHTLSTFLRKVGNGEIPLPVVRLDKSQKGLRVVHITDLAEYIDKRAEAARREARALSS